MARRWWPTRVSSLSATARARAPSERTGPGARRCATCAGCSASDGLRCGPALSRRPRQPVRAHGGARCGSRCPCDWCGWCYVRSCTSVTRVTASADSAAEGAMGGPGAVLRVLVEGLLAQDHEGDHGLTGGLVAGPDDCGLGDHRVRDQSGLDLRR